jgi:hypothetical protein
MTKVMLTNVSSYKPPFIFLTILIVVIFCSAYAIFDDDQN